MGGPKLKNLVNYKVKYKQKLYLEPQRPLIVILPCGGSMSNSPPAKELGKSLARSKTKYGLESGGKVNLSSPARRVAVASILISLSKVRVK